MTVLRPKENPIITPEDIMPSAPGLKVVGAFNCGVTKFNGETLLLIRVAEAPVKIIRKLNWRQCLTKKHASL